MTMNRFSRNAVIAFAGLSFLLLGASARGVGLGQRMSMTASQDRSPVDLAISADGKWVVTANETSDSVSLLRRTEAGRLEWSDEIRVGRHPADIGFAPDGQHILVSCEWSGDLIVLKRSGNRLELVRSIDVGFQPRGLAISSVAARAYLGLIATGQVAELDWQSGEVLRRIDVGKWPRYLTLSHDDQKLAVGCSADATINILDLKSGEELYQEPLANGINLGHMITSPDGKHTYFTWMVYRTNPINVSNIRRGWVLASRIGRVSFDGPAYREAISLDVPRRAVADPHGIVISADAQRIVASSSGTHELLVYRLPDLPLVGAGGPGDLIDRQLERDRSRFNRIDVGGRPMGLAMTSDPDTVYVANFLRNSVQVVDLRAREVVSECSLGAGELTLARKGMAIFYDAQRSLEQWYSCHSCHQNGGTNSRPMDTMNDGSEFTLKTVLPLHHLHETAPWTWHGWQEDLNDAMQKSFVSTMQGKRPSQADTEALLAYLQTLKPAPNPFRRDGKLSAAAERGRLVFESERAGCANCHHGPHFSDGQIHDVGLGSEQDRYEGFNTPSLRGVYLKTRLLHSGRARSLERVVNDLHSPEKVTGAGKLSEAEAADLIEYLKSL